MKLFLLMLFFTVTAGATEKVNLPKYMGLWHESYSIPQSFQKGCLNVTAEYKLEGEEVLVTNTCRDENKNTKKVASAVAVVEDSSKNYLKVYFWRPFGLKLFGGDYYVLKFDPKYQWAIVGTPDHEYGWVLTREKKPSKKLMAKIKGEVKDLGYDLSKFNKTNTDIQNW